jgi:hypothetical protein
VKDGDGPYCTVPADREANCGEEALAVEVMAKAKKSKLKAERFAGV